MKILALLGSPRPKGNTQAVLEIVLAAAEKGGAQTETIQISQLNDLAGCMECFKCQQSDPPDCAIDDDMKPVLDQALEADLILWATPVFCWSPAWPLKIALDRFYSLFKIKDGKEVESLLAGRKMAAVISAGGGEQDGADLVGETFRRMTEFSKCQWLGAFVATFVDTPQTIRADRELVSRARAFGRQLAS